MQGNHGEYRLLPSHTMTPNVLQSDLSMSILEMNLCLAMLARSEFGSLAEIERDSSKRTFQSFSARYPTPYKQSNSTNPLYYSFDYGGEPTSLFIKAPLTVARHHLSHACTTHGPKHVNASILRKAARDEASNKHFQQHCGSTCLPVHRLRRDMPHGQQTCLCCPCRGTLCPVSSV